LIWKRSSSCCAVELGAAPWRAAVPVVPAILVRSGIQSAFSLGVRRADAPAEWCGWFGEVDGADRGAIRMRSFTDSTGLEWTVFEVKKAADGAGPDSRWTYLPEQFGRGWLCFESDVSKRRLTPVPPRWRDYSDRELVGLLDRAQPVNRVRPSAEDRPNAD